MVANLSIYLLPPKSPDPTLNMHPEVSDWTRLLIDNKNHWAREMVQWLKSLPLNPDDRRSFSGTDKVGGENWVSELSSDLHECHGTYTPTSIKTRNKKKPRVRQIKLRPAEAPAWFEGTAWACSALLAFSLQANLTSTVGCKSSPLLIKMGCCRAKRGT